MILDAQNLHTFSQSPSNSSLANLEALVFRCHLLVCSRAEDAKLEVLSVSWLWFVALFGSQHCSFVSVSLKELTVAITGPAVVLSMQYSYKTECRSYCQLLAILIGMQGR